MVCRDRQTAFLPGLKAGVSCLYEDERCGCTKYLVPARPTLLRRLLSFPRLRRGISMPFCRHRPPHPRLRWRIPGYLAGDPHPTRAFGAPPPPPPGGGVRAWRYLVGSRIRGAAGGPPCPVFLQDLPVHWTVGISPRGVGLTGRGNLFPLPCLLRSKYLTSPASPTPPAPSALLPRPLPGAGSVRGDTWWAAVSGVIPGGPPCPGCCRRAAVPLGAALTAASRSGQGSGSH